jgi:ribulose-5-phosphate 4-epimerase/fuculose-1-phosphate aldolase
MTATEQTLRKELAAAFRWTARLNLHEATANHYSVVVGESGKEFLMNPFMAHFSKIKASDLILLNTDDDDALNQPGAPDPTAWHLHAYIHAKVPRAKCIMHTHMPYATALATLEDPTLVPVCQNTARFYNNVAYDRDYGGMFLSEDEPKRVVSLLGDKDVMLLGGHGAMVVGPSVAYVFDTLYHLERAAMNLMLAYSSGRPVKKLSDEVAAITKKQWDDFPGFSDGHFQALMGILDEEEPQYKN